MKYEKIYKSLIEKARSRSSLNEYCEKHHIVPRCMNGTNDLNNIVALYPEEHFIAHLLLVKIYPGNHSLIYAANMMHNRIKSNKEYGWLKRKFSEAEKANKTGVPRSKESVEKQKATIRKNIENGTHIAYMKGKTHSTETKKKMSMAHKGKTINDKSKSDLNGYIIRYGEKKGTTKYNEDSKKKDSTSIEYHIKKYGEEEGIIRYHEKNDKKSKRQIGENNHFYGKNHTKESKKKISESKKGKKVIRTAEHNKKIGLANRGKKHKMIKCKYCDKKANIGNLNRWHNDNCKHKPLIKMDASNPRQQKKR